MIATEKYSIDTITAAVRSFLQSEIPRNTPKYVPSAEEFSARCEYKRAVAIAMDRSFTRQPAQISNSSVRVDFKDWRIIHRDKAEELRRKGYTLTAEGQEVKSRYSGVPVGSVLFWSTGEIWAPAQRTS